MRRTIRLRESELRHMIAESVRRVLNEGDGSYKGVYIEGLGLPERVAMSKIDTCIKKGWSTDEIQRAVDSWVTESIGKKVTKGKTYWSDTNKRQTHEWPYDETHINYTGGRPGIMWDADEAPLNYKQSKF